MISTPAACTTGSGSGGPEMDALRKALSEAEEENGDLKAELNAFDPKFFEVGWDFRSTYIVIIKLCHMLEKQDGTYGHGFCCCYIAAPDHPDRY